MLEGLGETEAVAHLADRCVGVRTADGRITWLGLTLSAGFGDTGQIDIVRGLVDDAGIRPPVRVEGDRLVPVVRQSRQGGNLLFLFNLESSPSRACVHLSWICQRATDLTVHRDLAVTDGALELELGPWETTVIYCAGAPR